MQQLQQQAMAQQAAANTVEAGGVAQAQAAAQPNQP